MGLIRVVFKCGCSRQSRPCSLLTTDRVESLPQLLQLSYGTPGRPPGPPVVYCYNIRSMRGSYSGWPRACRAGGQEGGLYCTSLSQEGGPLSSGAPAAGREGDCQGARASQPSYPYLGGAARTVICANPGAVKKYHIDSADTAGGG